MTYIDDSILSFQGHKYELRFLTLLIEQEYNGEKILIEKVNEIFEQIQSNNNIKSPIKNRIKTIYEFYKYK